jgi:hypothetical protein
VRRRCEDVLVRRALLRGFSGHGLNVARCEPRISGQSVGGAHDRGFA